MPRAFRSFAVPRAIRAAGGAMRVARRW
jgi:hypothetical protein